MNSVNADQLFEQAKSQYRAGRPDDARALCRQILTIKPEHHEALHLLGIVEYESGQIRNALTFLQRAVQVNPQAAHYQCNLGLALLKANRPDEAMAVLSQSLKLKPTYPDAWNNMGSALRAAGRLGESIAAYRQAIALRSAFVDAYVNLADALREYGEIDESIQACRVALSLQPHSFEAFNHLGNALKDKARLEESIAAYQRALAIHPNSVEALTNLGGVLRRIGRLDEAIASYRRAIELQGDFADAHNGLGAALRDAGQYDDAAASYREAIKLRPNWALPTYNLSLISLIKGNFETGWPSYEARLRAPELSRSRIHPTGPRWTGDSLSDRTILLHAEQGIGDTLQFCRYAPLVAKRGGRITLMCQPELIRLLGGLEGVERLIGLNDSPGPFDVHCPLMSLPMLFGTTLQNIPSEVPYLKADPGPFKDPLSQEKRPKVGLAWAGRKEHLDDRNRSIDPKLLMPLLEKKEICFVSLQKEDSQSLPGLIDWTKELNDFADTASLIQNLDLIITVDTAVAHLAGALGKTTWVLLPHVPDWRWLLEREDSPWYPTLRLFRQKARGEWKTTLDQVGEALGELPR